MRNKSRKRPQIRIPVPPARIETIDEKVVGFQVDAAYVWACFDSGRIMVGNRTVNALGIQWSEVEPIPGTVRAYILNVLREEAARAEK